MKQQFPPVCCSSLAVALVKRCSWACQTCSIYWKQIVDHKWPKRASAIKCVHSTHGNTMKAAFFFTKPYLVWTWLQHLWPTQPSQVGKGTESGLDQPNIPFLILPSKIDQCLCCMGLFVSYSNSIVSLLDYCQARTGSQTVSPKSQNHSAEAFSEGQDSLPPLYLMTMMIMMLIKKMKMMERLGQPSRSVLLDEISNINLLACLVRLNLY